MRTHLFAGLGLAATATVLVILGSALELELQPVALPGAAIGAVLALVADRSAGARLAAFAAGFAAAWIGYLVRAQFLPDTDGGRAAFAGLVVLLGLAVVLIARDRLPLWGALLGAAAFAGAFEAAYAAAPAQVLSTSMSSATPLLFTVGAGFLVATLVAPAAPATTAAERIVERDLVGVGR